MRQQCPIPLLVMTVIAVPFFVKVGWFLKASFSWFGRLLDVQEETGDVEEGSAPGWQFWQANEKKTDGQATQTLLPGFMRSEAAGKFPNRLTRHLNYFGFLTTLCDTLQQYRNFCRRPTCFRAYPRCLSALLTTFQIQVRVRA